MKRLLFAGLLGVITSLGLRAGEPTTMWPYLFDDFMEASIYSKSGNKGEAKVNIHLLRTVPIIRMISVGLFLPTVPNSYVARIFLSRYWARHRKRFSVVGRRAISTVCYKGRGLMVHRRLLRRSIICRVCNSAVSPISITIWFAWSVKTGRHYRCLLGCVSLSVVKLSMRIKNLFRSSCPNQAEKSSMYFLKRIRSSGVRSIICKRFLDIFLLF